MTQEESVRIFKCLSDKSRLQIVAGLMDGEAYAELIGQGLSLLPRGSDSLRRRYRSI